jgi:hypothetical protein
MDNLNIRVCYRDRRQRAGKSLLVTVDNGEHKVRRRAGYRIKRCRQFATFTVTTVQTAAEKICTRGQTRMRRPGPPPGAQAPSPTRRPGWSLSKSSAPAGETPGFVSVCRPPVTVLRLGGLGCLGSEPMWLVSGWRRLIGHSIGARGPRPCSESDSDVDSRYRGHDRGRDRDF